MSFVFAFLAGVLSILSPCVLPLLPLVLGAAISKNRYGIYALTAGLALSFVILGLFLATAGFTLGLNQDIFRQFAAIILLIMGLFLLFPKLFLPLSQRLTSLTSILEVKFAGKMGDGLFGQLLTGILLGVIWTPCVGPTLGAASILAAKGENLAEVAGIMLVFGIGVAIPLLLIGIFAIKNLRFMASGIEKLKSVFGILLILTAILILTGYDKVIEAYLISISPSWLSQLSTYF